MTVLSDGLAEHGHVRAGQYQYFSISHRGEEERPVLTVTVEPCAGEAFLYVGNAGLPTKDTAKYSHELPGGHPLVVTIPAFFATYYIGVFGKTESHFRILASFQGIDEPIPGGDGNLTFTSDRESITVIFHKASHHQEVMPLQYRLYYGLPPADGVPMAFAEQPIFWTQW
eukprot:tig00020554_g10799.t1